MRSFYFILLAVFLTSIRAQIKKYDLKIESTEPKLSDLITSLSFKNLDSINIFEQSKKTQSILRKKGYLLSTGKLNFSDTIAILKIDLGKKLNWGKLNLSYPDSFALPAFYLKGSSGKVLSPQSAITITDQYLNYLEDNGYPFASTYFKDKRLQNDTLYATLHIEPNNFICFDSITVKGHDKFSTNILYYDLGFRAGMPYSETYLKKLSQLINQVEYLSFNRNPAIAFQKNKTVLYLYMERVKSNQIDGVIGLNTARDGKVTFNGGFQLRLLNAFKTGEDMRVRWHKPDDNIQSLSVSLGFPYLLSTPFWLEASLEILKQDSSFVNTGIKGGLKYPLLGRNFISVQVDYTSSNVLISQLEGNPIDFGDYNAIKYKLGMELNQINRVLIPTKGNLLRVFSFSGSRNTSTGSLEQYGWEIDESFYWFLSNWHIIKLGMLSSSLYSPSLFINELYRIGGLKTLRGFNEQSIFSSAYGIGTVEYRFMIGEYSYLTAFSDFAYSEQNLITSFATNTFVGIGVGINFRSVGGVFSFYYALGKDDVSSFEFRTSKIHLGYVNRF